MSKFSFFNLKLFSNAADLLKSENLNAEQKTAMKHPNVLGAGAEKRKHLKGKEKVGVVMSEFKRGTLHSGDGSIVTNRKQAIAIAMSEAGLSKAENTEKEIGVDVEKEHADTIKFIKDFFKKHHKFPPDEDVYESIADDHLYEFANYYTELKKMESKLENKKQDEVQKSNILKGFVDSDIEKAKAFMIGQLDKSGKNVKTALGWKPVKTHGHLVQQDTHDKTNSSEQDTDKHKEEKLNDLLSYLKDEMTAYDSFDEFYESESTRTDDEDHTLFDAWKNATGKTPTDEELKETLKKVWDKENAANTVEQIDSNSIGTVVNGFKKVGENQWRKVSKMGLTKPEHFAEFHRYSKEGNEEQSEIHRKHANTLNEVIYNDEAVMRQNADHTLSNITPDENKKLTDLNFTQSQIKKMSAQTRKEIIEKQISGRTVSVLNNGSYIVPQQPANITENTQHINEHNAQTAPRRIKIGTFVTDKTGTNEGIGKVLEFDTNENVAVVEYHTEQGKTEARIPLQNLEKNASQVPPMSFTKYATSAQQAVSHKYSEDPFIERYVNNKVGDLQDEAKQEQIDKYINEAKQQKEIVKQRTEEHVAKSIENIKSYTPEQKGLLELVYSSALRLGNADKRVLDAMQNKLIELSKTNNIQKSMNTDIEKGGEGSRGGKIIGHTRSGKPIYERKNAKHESTFTSADHKDAAYAHLDYAVKLHKESNSDASDFHHGRFDEHMKTARHKQMNAELDAEDTNKHGNFKIADKHKISNVVDNVGNYKEGKVELDKEGKLQLKKASLSEFGACSQEDIIKSHIDWQFGGSPNTTINKKGFDIKEKLMNIKSKESAEIVQKQAELVALKAQIVDEPTEKIDEYITDDIEVANMPLKYNWSECYSECIKDSATALESPNLVQQVSELKRKYNLCAEKFVKCQVEVKMLDTMINNFEDEKIYNLTVKQATILGF